MSGLAYGLDTDFRRYGLWDGEWLVRNDSRDCHVASLLAKTGV